MPIKFFNNYCDFLASIAFLVSTQSFAKSYLCLGVDENDGFVRVEAKIDPNATVKPFAHLTGQELRLVEMTSSTGQETLGLTIKKGPTHSDIISLVVYPPGFEYSVGNSRLSCIQELN